MDLRVGSRIEHLEAEDLDAAGGGASAAADEHEGKHEGQHEAAPGSVVGGGEAAAGHDGDDVEGAVAQGIERPHEPAIEKPQSNHPDGRSEDGEEPAHRGVGVRSDEHTSELQSLIRLSYAVFC